MPLNDKFRRLWKAAGYQRGHGSDAVLPPAGAGFKRLYYLTGPEHAISNIVFGRIKVSRFSELNDPFELFAQNFGKAEVRNRIRNYKNEFNEKKGLICFSADWTDPVLWSYYAAKHKGMALGFDVKESLVKEVQYSPARLKFKMPEGAKDIPQDFADLLVCTKFESWGYEREWRLLCDLAHSKSEGGLYFLPFGELLKLVEVIMGPLCEFDLKKIRSLVDSNHENVMTYKARLAYRSFRVIPMGSSVQGRFN